MPGLLAEYQRNFAILHQILDEAAADTGAQPNGIEGKVGHFYRLGIDTAKIDDPNAVYHNLLTTMVRYGILP